MLPLIPRRTSVMAKKELFDYPLLGKTMRLGSLVPVDRENRDAGISAVRAAAAVLRKGINMTIYVEGHRSFDGKLLPFKKGPFYLAMECGVPVVPVTISGSHYVMPKGRFAIKPGTVTLIFHAPIEPRRLWQPRGTDGESQESDRQRFAEGDAGGTNFLRFFNVLRGQSLDALARTARAISGSLLSSAEYFSQSL